MSKYKERKVIFEAGDGTATADVTKLDLNDIGAGDHFHLTPTTVWNATAGTETGQIDYHATEATLTSNVQTAIQALGGIYADATVANGTTAAYKVVTLGSAGAGYDVTWAITNASGFTGGASTETTPGKYTYTGTIPIGRFAIIKRVRVAGFTDNSLDVSIVDAGSKNVFVTTAIDTYTGGSDTPFDKYLTADGVAGEDGAAAANVSSGLFEGPLTVTVATSSPVREGYVMVVAQMGRSSGLKLRSTGAFTGASTTVNLGADGVKVKRIKLTSSLNNSVAPTVTDAFSKNVYVKSSTDYTTAVDVQLSHEGVDQANNAVADLLDVVVKSPVTVAQTGLGSGTFTVDFYVET